MSQIKMLKSATDQQLLELLAIYQSADWWDSSAEDYRLIDSIIQRSFCFAIAEIDGKIVAMGRSISDGISDAYIQDIAVLPQYRGRGLGQLIVKEITNYLLKQNISWIGLIATPGNSMFYQKIGFSVMENFTPMLWRNENKNVT